ncbi:MAG TPA: hypothetical protein VF132_07725 [Rudaea sp.]
METGEFFDAAEILPPHLRDFMTITEIDSGSFLAGRLFEHKFRQTIPPFPRHLVALYRDRTNDGLYVASFSHMRPMGDVYLSGGSCSSGDTYRRMAPEERQALSDAGGPWYFILKYAFRKYAACCDAFFGYCGDARALDVAQHAGFILTQHQHLIVHWQKPLAPERQAQLIEYAHGLGPF